MVAVVAKAQFTGPFAGADASAGRSSALCNFSRAMYSPVAYARVKRGSIYGARRLIGRVCAIVSTVVVSSAQ